MEREKIAQYSKDLAAFVAIEVQDKEKMDIEVLRNGDKNLQLVALCTFISSFAQKNGKKASDLIPFFTNILINNSKEGE